MADPKSQPPAAPSAAQKPSAAPAPEPPPPQAAGAEPALASPFRSLEPAVANVRPGSLVMTDPRDRRKDDDKDPLCYSVIHDRPKVAVSKGERAGDVDDLARKARGFFHKDGICPCQDPDMPQPVTESQRWKQLVRAARGDDQLWVEDDLETARAKARARERLKAAKARK